MKIILKSPQVLFLPWFQLIDGIKAKKTKIAETITLQRFNFHLINTLYVLGLYGNKLTLVPVKPK